MSVDRLVVWRHGRTEWNRADRMQGQADVPLDAVGEAQAAAAAQELAKLDPDAIVASDLSRAIRTAQALADLTGLEIAQDKALREIDVDDWEGESFATIAERFPERAARIRAGESERRGNNGETVAEVAERFDGALTRIVSEYDVPTVVIATHGLAARVGILRWVGLPEQHWSAFGGFANCGWATLTNGRRGWRIEEWNAQSLPAPVEGAEV